MRLRPAMRHELWITASVFRQGSNRAKCGPSLSRQQLESSLRRNCLLRTSTCYSVHGRLRNHRRLVEREPDRNSFRQCVNGPDTLEPASLLEHLLRLRQFWTYPTETFRRSLLKHPYLSQSFRQGTIEAYADRCKDLQTIHSFHS